MSDLTLLVSRHPGAKAWLAAEVARRGWIPVQFVDHLDPDADLAGIRRVAGTLPLGLAGRLVARGIEIWHVDLTLDADRRGRELSRDDMQRCQARLLRVIALQLED